MLASVKTICRLGSCGARACRSVAASHERSCGHDKRNGHEAGRGATAARDGVGPRAWTVAIRIHDWRRPTTAHTDDSRRGLAAAEPGDRGGQDAIRSPARRARRELLRSGSRWLLGPSLSAVAGRRESRGRSREHRDESPGTPGEDRPSGCRAFASATPALRPR